MKMLRDSVSIDRPREIEEWRDERRIKKQENWVVVIVVLAVSLSLIVTFSFLLMFRGGSFTTTAEPNIQLSEDPISGTIIVAGVSEAKDLNNFQALLLRNGTQDGEAMNPLREATVDQIMFSDLNGDGRLSVGDFFTIEMVPDSSYTLAIIWGESGNVRGSQDWET
jgi:hypothetical protein